MPNGYYTVGEVLWLISLRHSDAVAEDASPPSALGHLSDALNEGGSSSSAGPELPVVARWQDVHAAKARVLARKGAEAMRLVELRAQGRSEEEIAKEVGLERSAVRRRVMATTRDVLDELGGESAGEVLALSHPTLCMRCGQRPRARWAAVKKRVKGGWRTVTPERQASFCAECVHPDVRAQLVGGDVSIRGEVNNEVPKSA